MDRHEPTAVCSHPSDSLENGGFHRKPELADIARLYDSNTTGTKGAHVRHDNSLCRTLTKCQNLTAPTRCPSEDEKYACSSKSKSEASQFEHWSLRCCGERLVTQLALKALGASLVERLIVLENVGEKKKAEKRAFNELHYDTQRASDHVSLVR